MMRLSVLLVAIGVSTTTAGFLSHSAPVVAIRSSCSNRQHQRCTAAIYAGMFDIMGGGGGASRIPKTPSERYVCFCDSTLHTAVPLMPCYSHTTAGCTLCSSNTEINRLSRLCKPHWPLPVHPRTACWNASFQPWRRSTNLATVHSGPQTKSTMPIWRQQR